MILSMRLGESGMSLTDWSSLSYLVDYKLGCDDPLGRVIFLRRELVLLMGVWFCRLKLNTEIGKVLPPAPEVRKFKKFMGLIVF
jgi:hypothetical protein